MLFIPAFIPPILCLIAVMVFFRHKIVIAELIAQLIAPLVISGLVCLTLLSGLTNDIEYNGYYVTAAKHEEDWNEYIYKMCSREHCSGSGDNRTCTTEYYDCSYVDYHPAKWYVILNDASSVRVDQGYYNRLVSTYGNQRKVGHHSGYTNDGDIFQTNWDEKWEHLQPYVTKNTYKNKVQASNSVFKFQIVTPEEAKAEGLYGYPKNDGFNASSVLGGSSPELDRINAVFGKRHQIKVWLLIYKDQPMSVFERQRSYWQGGNKNELVLGVGTKGGKVTWANQFSWSEADQFKIDCRTELEKLIGQPWNDDGICAHLKKNIPTGWKRKEFADFEYLKVDIPTGYSIIIFVISLITSGGLAAIFVMNNLNAGREERSTPKFAVWIQERWKSAKTSIRALINKI